MNGEEEEEEEEQLRASKCEEYGIRDNDEWRPVEDFDFGKKLYEKHESSDKKSELNDLISSDHAKPRVREGYRAAEAIAVAEKRMGKYEGMEKVKEKVRSMLLSAIDKLQHGGNSISINSGTSANYNSIIMGNSGVGKSDLVENVLYPALTQLGVLTGKLVKVSAADLPHVAPAPRPTDTSSATRPFRGRA